MRFSGSDGLTQSRCLCLQWGLCIEPLFCHSPTNNVQNYRAPRPPTSASGPLDKERLIHSNIQNPVNQGLPKSSHFKAKRHREGRNQRLGTKSTEVTGLTPLWLQLLTEGGLYSASGRQPREKAMKVQICSGFKLSPLESKSSSLNIRRDFHHHSSIALTCGAFKRIDSEVN